MIMTVWTHSTLKFVVPGGRIVSWSSGDGQTTTKFSGGMFRGFNHIDGDGQSTTKFSGGLFQGVYSYILYFGGTAPQQCFWVDCLAISTFMFSRSYYFWASTTQHLFFRGCNYFGRDSGERARPLNIYFLEVVILFWAHYSTFIFSRS